MILPEEVPGMSGDLRTARERWTKEDLEDSAYRLKWFGAILGGLALYYFFGGFLMAGRLVSQSGEAMDFAQRLGFGFRSMIGSTYTGLALLMFIILAFLPWYQARKRGKELVKWTEEGMVEFAPTIRFETWLAAQKSPVTKVILGLITLVALTQLFANFQTGGIRSLFAIFGEWSGTMTAGLVKSRYFSGEWWRLLTAPFLHGNIVHFLMNSAALLYLGKRLEVFARWPHLPLVFLFAAAVGGEASARFLETPSVGASGGLMGWLGFLMVFETLHKGLVPRRARRRLAAGVAITALIGVIGYKFIDNAAHAGGLIAGILYGLIVFPPTSSPHRPRSTNPDKFAGGAALGVLAIAALFAIARILSAG